jgi:metalloendopeptidase OMA1, mitochondrial
VYNLEEVPLTHRRRFNLITPTTEKELFGSNEMYQSTLQQFRGKVLSENHPLTKQVAHVVEKLLPVTKGLAGDDWRVHVIDDPEMKNAFVMPGGKVFVFTGILPICKDEAGLAAVLAHEIAHNVAHHVSERVSRSAFITGAAILTSLVFDVSGGFASQISELLLSLPNSRTQEAEADHIGLLMMAEACYDPRAALHLWERMNAAEKYSPPGFLSTHPTNYNRIQSISGWLPQAESVYENSDCGSLAGYNKGFQALTGGYRQDVYGANQPAGQTGRRSRPTMGNGPAQVENRRRDDDDDFF